MAMTIHVDIVSAEESIYSGLVRSSNRLGNKRGEVVNLSTSRSIADRLKAVKCVTERGKGRAVFIFSGGNLRKFSHTSSPILAELLACRC